MMTDTERKHTTYLRENGAGYGSIAVQLGVSISTIKTFCRRNNLQRKDVEDFKKGQGKYCRHCGHDITQQSMSTKRRYCSDQCRHAWWKAHDYPKKHTFYTIICAHCGESFQSYGNINRKYCSHKCYISARYYRKKDD